VTNEYQLLVGAEAFVGALRVALEQCTQRLYIQFSTFEGDSSGRAFADLLIKRAQLGVDVRLMIDHYSSMVQDDIYPILLHRRAELSAEKQKTRQLIQSLQEAGVAVQYTAPLGPLGIYFPYRNHKKMIIIDDQLAFVGGINVSDHNYRWHDFMVKVCGPIVQDLAQDYLSTWEGQTFAYDKPSPDTDFLLNQCAGRYSLFEHILQLIDSAEKTLVIESPYLLGERIESAILAAAQRGVKITIILPFRSNKWLYRVWVRKLYRRLNHPNIRLYGYRGEHDMTHAKLMMVDDEVVTFGSFNMFELEGLTQKDLNIFTRNQSFIRQVKDFIAQDIAESVLIATPKSSFGRFSYTWLYYFVRWWTNFLLRNERWRLQYAE